MKWFLIFVIVSCTVASDVLQAHEMKQHGEITDFRRAGACARDSGKRRFLILSSSAWRFLSCVSPAAEIAPLSFSVPATALTYVGDAVCALRSSRALKLAALAGIAMIAGGVMALSL
jgi:hypothetical protein